MKKVIASLLMISVLGLTGCDKVVNERVENNIGTVMDKCYVPESYWIQTIPCGKSYVPVTYYSCAEYNVTIKFQDKNKVIDNKELYENIRLYDTVPITVTYSTYESGKQTYDFELR